MTLPKKKLIEVALPLEAINTANVRMTPDLHRRLAIRAAEANVSLNRIVSDQLAKP